MSQEWACPSDGTCSEAPASRLLVPRLVLRRDDFLFTSCLSRRSGAAGWKEVNDTRHGACEKEPLCLTCISEAGQAGLGTRRRPMSALLSFLVRNNYQNESFNDETQRFAYVEEGASGGVYEGPRRSGLLVSKTVWESIKYQ